jgi:hypothetical protein
MAKKNIAFTLLALVWLMRSPASAATVIASAGTIDTATSHPQQRQLFYDGTRWWAFYFKSTGADTLYYAYSSDLTSWTESSLALPSTVSLTGKPLSIWFDSATATVIVPYYTDATNNVRYVRGNISGTSITWSATTLYYDDAVACDFCCHKGVYATIDSNNKVIISDCNNDYEVFRSTNSISTSFADTGGQWNSLGSMITGLWTLYYKIIPKASGELLAITSDSEDYMDTWEYDGSVWNELNWRDSGNFNLGSNPLLNWDAVKVSNTAIYILAATSAGFSFQRYDGSGYDPTDYTSLAVPSQPSGGLATNSGISLVTDGTDIWAFIIRGDANSTVSYSRYLVAVDDWTGWADVTATSEGRAYVQVSQNTGNSTIGVLWTQVNGSDYDIAVASISTAVFPPPDVTVIHDAVIHDAVIQ